MINEGNLIQLAKKQVDELTQSAYQEASEKGLLPAGANIQGVVEIPKEVSHGDYASSFAMVGAKTLKQNPRAIAQILVDHLKLEGSYFQSVSIAGAGFLNFTLSPLWYQQVLEVVENKGKTYGSVPEKNGKSVMVEFVSANPTGKMHIGNARGGVLGDTLANLLDFAGWKVWKEFYVNDAGNQIQKFFLSIQARYRQLIYGEETITFPEEGYQGDDIRELAQLIFQEHGDAWDKLPETEQFSLMTQIGLKTNCNRMKQDLERYGIHYDQWFYESSLYEDGSVEQALKDLEAKGCTYEKEGAIWLNTTELLKKKFMAEGKTQEQVDKLELKDDVLKRANGFYTYFAADIAYHRNKLETRNFDLGINIWGADHHGHVARIQAAMDALDQDGSHRLVVVLMQLVNLVQDGKPVRMAKRKGTAIALEDLLDEISVDAARYFFNSRVSTTSLDFDMGLAVRQDSENPVYYVQYAHARICSLISRLGEEGVAVENLNKLQPALLDSSEEKALLKAVAQFPEEILLAARDYDPSRINRYLVALAGDFHRFYSANRISGEEKGLSQVRLKLADATRQVLSIGLQLLGVSAPLRMTKLEEIVDTGM